MEDRIRLKIVTPSGVAMERDVRYVRLPTPEGSVGILANHAPMLCAVGKGRLLCRFEGEGELSVRLGGGVAEIENNALTVLAEEASIEE